MAVGARLVDDDAVEDEQQRDHADGDRDRRRRGRHRDRARHRQHDERERAQDERDEHDARDRHRLPRRLAAEPVARTSRRAAPTAPTPASSSPLRSLRRSIAQPPARAIRAACSVLRSRNAIVIGPTPPGTGVIAPATSLTASKSTSPAEAVLRAVHADVDDDRARLHPVGLHHLRARPTAAMSTSARRQTSARSRVREWHDRHRRVGAEQQLRHRLAEEVRAPDDDRLGAFELRARRVEQRHDALRRARPQPLDAEREPAGADRRQAVDVLVGVDHAR